MFDPLTLTLEFDPFFKNFNLAHYFGIVSARALIFHMNIPCDEIFLYLLNLLVLTFDQFNKKKFTLVITSEK